MEALRDDSIGMVEPSKAITTDSAEDEGSKTEVSDVETAEPWPDHGEEAKEKDCIWLQRLTLLGEKAQLQIFTIQST